MMGLCRDLIKTRLSMIVGTGAIRTEDSIEYAVQAKANGADALLIATPPYVDPNSAETVMHCLAIDSAANMPAMLPLSTDDILELDHVIHTMDAALAAIEGDSA